MKIGQKLWIFYKWVIFECVLFFFPQTLVNWFFDNFCRLDEKLPAKKTSTSNVRKNEEYVVENLKFETKTDKKVEESKTKSEYKPLELKKQPLEDATNALKDKVKTF